MPTINWKTKSYACATPAEAAARGYERVTVPYHIVCESDLLDRAIDQMENRDFLLVEAGRHKIDIWRRASECRFGVVD